MATGGARFCREKGHDEEKRRKADCFAFCFPVGARGTEEEAGGERRHFSTAGIPLRVCMYVCMYVYILLSISIIFIRMHAYIHILHMHHTYISYIRMYIVHTYTYACRYRRFYLLPKYGHEIVKGTFRKVRTICTVRSLSTESKRAPKNQPLSDEFVSHLTRVVGFEKVTLI